MIAETLVAAIGLAAPLSNPGAPHAAERHVGPVLKAVLAHSASTGGRVCVKLIAIQSQGLDATLRPGKEATARAFRWVAPRGGAELPSATKANLDRQLHRALVVPPPLRVFVIPPAWLRGNQVRAREEVPPEDCDQLRIGTPRLSGNYAFVETDVHCGRLCGHGQQLALRRTGSTWRVVARFTRWIA